MGLDYRNILVVGGGVSGQGAISALQLAGVSCTLWDDNTNSDIMDIKDIKIDAYDALVISPSIPMSHKLCMLANSANIPIIGEIELAYRLERCRVIAVTGTNGKTTTTRLIGEIMTNDMRIVSVAGNIGVSASYTAMQSIDKDMAIYEVSSFQLMSTKIFRPHIAVVTNITPDHLDVHKAMSEYCDIKMSIAKNQTESDYLVLSIDEMDSVDIAQYSIKSSIYFVSAKQRVRGAYMNGSQIYFNDELVCDIGGIPSKTIPYMYNALCATCVAKILGIANNVIQDTIYNFKLDKHRIELVNEFAGIRFFDDSKGTNIEATLGAIESMDGDTALILGGSDKCDNFDRLFDKIDDRVKYIYVIGETKDKIITAANDILSRRRKAFEIFGVGSLRDAVEMASLSSVNNVLLSPACASFDMFEDYSDRGRRFCNIVSELKASCVKDKAN